MKLGSGDISKIYLGSGEVNKIYLGEVEVYSGVNNAFEMEIDTTKAGSASDTFIIPLYNGETYDFNVDWGDGSNEDVSGSSLTEKSHTYDTGGEYTVSITGTFPRIYFNNSGDKLKLLDVSNWGDIVWSNMYVAFFGCNNATFTASDRLILPVVCTNMLNTTNMNNSVSNWDFSSVGNMQGMFRGTPFNQDVLSIDTSNVSNMSFTFFGCADFNQDVSNFDTSNVTTMNSIFRFAYDFDQDLSSWDITSLTNVGDALQSSSFSQTNYDLLLVAWEAQEYNDDVEFHAGTAKYSSGAPATAKANLVTDGWIITDGGEVV